MIERRLPLRNITLAAKLWGDPGLPPLLAVHGWLDNAASFDRLAPLLIDHHVVAVDLAGHGRSDHHAPGNWYAYVDYLGDIAEVIAHFGWSRVDLLGHSLGATLASVFASVHPQQVGQLLLVEGLGPLSSPAERTLDSLRRALEARADLDGDRLRVFASIEAAVEARCRSGAISAGAARGIVERGITALKHPVEGEGCDGFRWSSDPRLTLPSAWRLSESQIAPII
ncbi:MAG: alpha/beta fold hydrolase, partial [Dokdonella sp.]